MTPTNNETVFYNENGVLVTASRFVSGGQTFPMRGITSVKHGRIGPSYFKWLLVSISLALLVIAISPENGITLAGGILALYALYVIFSRSRHIVLIATAAGEVSAHSSTKRSDVDKIVAALTESIVQRG